MKKKAILFCTDPRMFLTELPLVALLTLAIIFNDKSAEALKLYPLILVISAAIILLFIYYFRVIIVSFDEIKIIGRFSSRDKAVINKNKRLVLTLKPGHKMTVELFGNDGKAPELDWAQNDDEYVPQEINLFREKAFSSLGGAARVLKYFGAMPEEASALVKSCDGSYENGDVAVKVETKNEIKTVEIVFLTTI